MSSMLEYKGYHAKIYFDAEDEIFVGEVFGLSDSLNFHGQNVDELKEMFHVSVDDYLELCQAIGKAPEKEFRGVFNVRISPESHRKAALYAYERDIPLNQFVAEAIDEKLKSLTTDAAQAQQITVNAITCITDTIFDENRTIHSAKEWRKPYCAEVSYANWGVQ